MTKKQALAYIATRLAKAQAINAIDMREARSLEERAFAQGQRLTLNEVSGWVVVAFGER